METWKILVWLQKHEFAGQNLRQLRPGVAGEARDDAEAQAQHRREHTDEHAPAEPVRARFHQEGEPAQLIAQHILDDEGEDEGGHRNDDHGHRGDGVVDPGVFPQSRPDAQADADGDAQEDGIEVGEDGGGQLLKEDIRHVLAEVQLVADAPVDSKSMKALAGATT